MPSEGAADLDRQHVHPRGPRRTRWTPSTYMDFVYRPGIAGMLAEYINYITPVPAAKDHFVRSRAWPSRRSSSPAQADLDRVHYFRVLTPEEETEWNEDLPTRSTRRRQRIHRRRRGRAEHPRLDDDDDPNVEPGSSGGAVPSLLAADGLPGAARRRRTCWPLPGGLVARSCSSSSRCSSCCLVSLQTGDVVRAVSSTDVQLLDLLGRDQARTTRSSCDRSPTAAWRQSGRSCLPTRWPTGSRSTVGSPRKGTYLFLVLLPFFVSFVIRTISWKFLLADDGIVLGQPSRTSDLLPGQLPRTGDVVSGRVRS